MESVFIAVRRTLLILTAKVLSPTLEVMRPSMAPCSVSNSCSLCRRPWWSRLQARTDTTDSRARTTTGPSIKSAKVSTRYRTGSPCGAVTKTGHISHRTQPSHVKIPFHANKKHVTLLYPPDGSRDINELMVVLLLHMFWEQQKIAWWRDGGVEQCKWILSSPSRQPRSNTTPLLLTLTEEKHRVPWHWVAWRYFGLSHRQASCPSVKEIWVHRTLQTLCSAFRAASQQKDLCFTHFLTHASKLPIWQNIAVHWKTDKQHGPLWSPRVKPGGLECNCTHHWVYHSRTWWQA